MVLHSFGFNTRQLQLYLLIISLTMSLLQKYIDVHFITYCYQNKTYSLQKACI